jgi:predicted outer membrane protein
MQHGRRTRAAVAATCGSVIVLATAAGAASSRAPSSFDSHWLRSGARADVFTIASARIAASQAIDPALRQAAASLAADQLRILARRQALARSLRVPLPRRADPVQTLQINQLSAATADAAIFEPLFADTQAAALQLAVLNAAEAARGAASPAVRKLARSTLPVLKRHFGVLSRLGR